MNFLPNYTGRYALGASSGINNLISAGLPNITGSFFGSDLMGKEGVDSQNGALFLDTSFSGKYDAALGDSSSYGLGFNASRSNSIYGNSSTVTPPSINTAFLIRHD